MRLVVGDPAVLPDASSDLGALLARVDRVASRFRPDSALSIANARAGKPTPVPRLLVDLVRAALDAAALTHGAVDPTVGLALRRSAMTATSLTSSRTVLNRGRHPPVGARGHACGCIRTRVC